MIRINSICQKKYFPYIILAFAVLLHRSVLLAYVYADYESLINQNEGYVTWQYLPLSILKDNLLIGLLYLQQNTPLPQIVVGLLLKILGSAHALSFALVGLQAIISLASTLLLYNLLRAIGIVSGLALIIAAVFALSADLVFLEYCSFGQLIYETLCMPFLLGLLLCLHRFLTERNVRYLFFAGVLVALLALSRTSAGYFFIVILGYLMCIRVRGRDALVFIFPVLMLQGGWVIKNASVYGYVSLPATSWTGLNMMRVISDQKAVEEVKRLVAARPEYYPEWFVRLVRDVGYGSWYMGRYAPYVPEEFKKIDAVIAERLPGNPLTNRFSLYQVSSYYKKAVVHYALMHPIDYAAKVFSSYKLFWHPIRDYTSRFTSLLYVEKTAEKTLRSDGLWGFIRGDYELGNNYILLKKKIPDRFRIHVGCPEFCKPAGVVVIPYVALIAYILNVFSIHVLGPLLVGVLLLSRREVGINRNFLFLLYLVFLYFAVVSSVGEQGENNRFRLAIEPVIWLLTANILMGFSRAGSVTRLHSVRARESS